MLVNQFGSKIPPAAGGGGGLPTTLSLLMHMDGVDGEQTFTDDGYYGHTVTPYNAAMTTKTTAPAPQFGTASADFGSGTAYMSVPNHSSLQLGTGDFCIDFWINVFRASVHIFVAKSASANYAIYSSSSNLWAYANGANFLSKTLLSDNTWTHVEFSRTSGVGYLGVDGVITSAALTVSLDGGTDDLWIGRDYGSSYFNSGRMDELRIQKGVSCGHTANFTPPTAPYDGTE